MERGNPEGPEGGDPHPGRLGKREFNRGDLEGDKDSGGDLKGVDLEGGTWKGNSGG